MTGFWICAGMLLWKSPEYSRIPSMPGFYICKCCTRFWIWLNNALWQGSECAWSTFHRVLNKPPALNMPGSEYGKDGICEGYTGCWICINKPGYAVIMSQYVWICLNKAGIWLNITAYTWKNCTEYAKILNVSA